jgi:hypothetical protein
LAFKPGRSLWIGLTFLEAGFRRGPERIPRDHIILTFVLFDFPHWSADFPPIFFFPSGCSTHSLMFIGLGFGRFPVFMAAIARSPLRDFLFG